MAFGTLGGKNFYTPWVHPEKLRKMGASSPSRADSGDFSVNAKGLMLKAESSGRGRACSATSPATTAPARCQQTGTRVGHRRQSWQTP